jgi:hypothetical protein
MKKTTLSILLAVILILSMPISCFAGDGWQANILITSGNASSRLTFGQHVDATDHNDGFYDVPALFSGELQAAFTGGGETLWRDIRGVGTETGQEWRLIVTSDTGEEIKVSWDNKGLPAEVSIALVDVETGKSIDMQVMSSYLMENKAGGALLIEVSNI